MNHLGDITKIDGHKVPLVDIVTGGSPCQDLSVAGKRAGLNGERSGLFMEQIRIIKEMRDESAKRLRSRGATFDIRHIRPRYMVWENVPGAFSSNKGEDFRAVLEETAKVVCENAVIPRPEKGKWSPSGCIMGDGWSIAWRVHDAQFWGVPQRRKRIALVADFGGDSAPKILFESKGMSRDIEESQKEGQNTSRSIGENLDKTISFQERAGKPGGGKGILIQHERTGALSTLNNQSVLSVDEKMGQTYIGDNVGNTLGARDYKQPQAVVYGMCSDNSNSMKSSNPYSGIYEAETSRTLDLNGGNPACNQGGMICLQRRFSSVNVSEDGITPTFEAGAGEGGNNMPIVLEGNGQRDSHKGDGYKESETMYTLNTVEQHGVCTYQQTTKE